MPKLHNNFNNISISLNLLDDLNKDLENSKSDRERWIPFEFMLQTNSESYMYDENERATLSVFETKKLISTIKHVLDSKRNKQTFERMEFSSCECYFDIIFYDPLEDNEVYIELWINMGTLTHGSISGFDKGFRFVTTLTELDNFAVDLEKQFKVITV